MKVHLWDDEHGYTCFDMARYAYRKDPNGKYTSLYGDKLTKITGFDDRDMDLFESDVQPELRVLMDAYPDSDDPSNGHRVLIFDIEVDATGGFPDISAGDKTVTAIAMYDKTADHYHQLVLDPEKKIPSEDHENVSVRSFQSEENLLEAFLNLWKQINPTIVTGWNTNGFDIPYMYNRIKAMLGKQAAYSMSPIDVAYQNKFTKAMIIAGVNCLDYLDLYKKFLGVMKPSYALGAVAKDEELKVQKITYKGSLTDLYKTDLKRYVEYNLADVKVVVELDKKYDFIHLAQAVCHKGHVPYEWFQMSSRWIDGAILMYLHRNGKIAPNKPIGGREEYEEMAKDGEDGFVGAYVKEPIAGLYEWVCSADITSLYPSVIMTLNISPETKVGKVEGWDYKAFVKGNLPVIRIGETGYTNAEFKEMLKDQKFSISSNGVMYRQPVKKIIGKILKKYEIEISGKQMTLTQNELDDLLEKNNWKLDSDGNIYEEEHVGVVPTILDIWFEERVKYRQLMKEFKKKGDKEKTDFYNRRQLRQKIFLNSVYGVLGLPVFRFYDRDNAEAVTVSGQTIIKSAESLVNRIFTKKFEAAGKTPTSSDFVKYIDTDSVYMSVMPLAECEPTLPVDMKKYTIEQVTYLAGQINEFYKIMVPQVFNVKIEKNRIKIIADVVAQKAMWVAKKRYAMLKVFDMETMSEVKDKKGNEGKLEVKGIDTVRSSFPAAFRKVAADVLEMLLRGKSKNEIDERILQFEESIDNVPLIDLAKTTSVKFVSQNGEKNYAPAARKRFQFVTGTPVGVKSALAYNDLLKIWQLDKTTQPIFHSQKIRWVYLIPNEFGIESLAMKGDDTDPDQIMELITKYVDRQAMYNAELKSKLSEFYEVMNWDYPNRGSQMAQDFFGGGDSSDNW